MANVSTTVYLEDIPVMTKKEAREAAVFLDDIQVSTKKETAVAPLAVATNTTNIAAATATTTGKRQRTLFDMQFAPDAGAKRQKLAAPAARFTAGSTTSTTTKPAPIKRAQLGIQRLNSIPFSLSAFVDALPEDARALLALECDTMGKSWLKVLADELAQPYFLALKRFLYGEGVRGACDPPPATIYPQPKDIYTWSNTPLGRVKVVILGQDPYPGRGQAHGLSFSVPPGVAVPASLQNIYTQLRTEYPSFTPPAHGHLESWTAQGVLLLNSVLTVRAGSPNSHAEQGWEALTDRVLRVVDAYGGANLPSNASPPQPTGLGRGVVVLAWGAKAAKRVAAAGLDKPGSKHLILRSAHPSPRSADSGFFGNGHFTKANAWLEERYGKEGVVDWCKL